MGTDSDVSASLGARRASLDMRLPPLGPSPGDLQPCGRGRLPRVPLCRATPQERPGPWRRGRPCSDSREVQGHLQVRVMLKTKEVAPKGQAKEAARQARLS